MAQQTAIDWYFDKIKSHFEHNGELFEAAVWTYEQAKEMEKEKEHELKQFWFGRGILAAKEDRISELKPKKES